MIGIVIGALRKKSGIKIEELAHGLCSTGMMRKYEEGIMEPEKLLADALLQRLGKSVDKYDITVDANEYRAAAERAQINVMLAQNRLEKAEIAIADYAEKQEKKLLHCQFIALAKAELYRKRKLPIEKQIDNVLYGLSQTISEVNTKGFNSRILENRRFCMTELIMLQRYAVLLQEAGREQESYEWHLNITGYFSKCGNAGGVEYDWSDMQKIYPFSAYWLAKIEQQRGDFEAALEWISLARVKLENSDKQSALFARVMQLRATLLNFMNREIPKWEQACMVYMNQMGDKSRDAWLNNWYPLYIERHIRSVNEVIAQRRKLYGMEEEDLALEICDARTVARIEKEWHMPQRKTRNRLLERLGISTVKYDGGLITQNFEDFKCYAELIRNINAGNQQKSKKLIERFKRQICTKYVTNVQFIKYWDLVCENMSATSRNSDYDRKLWEQLTSTLPETRHFTRYQCDLNEYERRLVKKLCGRRNGYKLPQLKKILFEQYRFLKSSVHRKYFFQDYYYEILYCLSVMNLYDGDLEEGIRRIDGERNLHYAAYTDFLWVQILFIRARMEEERSGNADQVVSMLCKAYAICKLYHKNEKLVKAIRKYMEQHFAEHMSELDEFID